MKKFYNIIIKLFPVLLIAVSFSCGSKPSVEKLSMTSKQVFALLPEKPQFVMYVNFKTMRTSEFWKQNISDSVLSGENAMGSILNVFKSATGASINDGLDEMFFANSWTGENAIILKGSFDKNKINSFLANDTIFKKTASPDGITVYTHLNSNLAFFLKDNFTLCASNYQKQIDYMKTVTDTSNSGLLANNELMKSIDPVIYKDNFWIVSTEKMFIRGIFANFTDMKSGKDISKEKMSDTLIDNQKDSLSKTDDVIMNKLYDRVNSVSLSGKMKGDLNIIMQFECVDAEASAYVTKLFNGIIGLAKLTSSAKKDKKETPFTNILNELSVSKIDNSVQISSKVTSNNVKEFREGKLLIK
ncbi:MAG: hypothetical protein PHN88_15820 [Ignavibacteria bacterium]|nr:hypothetical protein [Ignavibacteria bacterium]